MEIKTYAISGMTCGSCAMRIEHAMNALKTVKEARVDFRKRELRIVSEIPMDVSMLQKTVAKLGPYSIEERTTTPSPIGDASPWIWGLSGTVFITAVFYLIQVLGMQNFKAPLDFIRSQWYLVVPLVVGFGIQTGLFRAIRILAHHGGGGVMATSGGISSGTMLACCAHNLVPLLPILGMSGFAAFFAAYPTKIFLLSIVITYLGVGYMTKKYMLAKRAQQIHPHL